MIGIKLAASRRADDPLLDPICRLAARARRADPAPHLAAPPPGVRRARRPPTRASSAGWRRAIPRSRFLLAHIGGGGDWLHSLHDLRGLPNVFVDLSGSGVDGGMLEACLEAVGVERLLWGCDLTIETGWAKLRYLEHLLAARRAGAGPLAQRRRHLPARRVPHRLMRIDVNAFVGAYPFRRVPGTSPEALLAAMDRIGDRPGLGHPPARRLLARSGRGQRLAAMSTAERQPASGRCRRSIPGSRTGKRRCAEARGRGAPAVRCDPTFYGIDPAGAAMRALAARLRRGRHAAHAGGAARGRPAAAPERSRAASCRRRRCGRWCGADPRVRLIVTHADRPFIEEVHFGSTPEEAAPHLVGHLLDLGSAGGSPADAAAHRRRGAIRVRHRPAAADSGEQRAPSSICSISTAEHRAAIEARATPWRSLRPVSAARLTVTVTTSR